VSQGILACQTLRQQSLLLLLHGRLPTGLLSLPCLLRQLTRCCLLLSGRQGSTVLLLPLLLPRQQQQPQLLQRLLLSCLQRG
jgi:hypothetical protein